MPRSGEPARQRLQRAALELYCERGYDNTTTAQIADHAGVTERTFFRHFTDKREVLFDGEATLRAELERGVADAPAGLDPLNILLCAFGAAIPLFEANRSVAEPRNQVIAVTPALRERALAKEASLIQALATALQRRGVNDRQAVLAAQMGMTAFTQAIQTWFDHPERDLNDHLAHAHGDVRALASKK